MEQKEIRKHFIESLYETLDEAISPTPYLEVSGEGKDIKVNFLDGKGRLPSASSVEITTLDLDLVSMFIEDCRPLYEGITGVGKSHTIDALCGAVFGSDGYCTVRLSSGVLGSSVLEPFTTTVLEDGMPKTKIDREKCSKYGAIFIDEINRGDSQEVLQVVDGTIYVNGEKGELRIPIPDTGRSKGLQVFAAMNPPDAQHRSALELDIAEENRFLKLKFPNGVSEAGSSQVDKRRLDRDTVDMLHRNFWESFKGKTGLKGGWKELYPVVTDEYSFKVELGGEEREFIDIAMGFVGYDPVASFDRNRELMAQGSVGAKFSVKKGNDLEKVLKAQNTLKQGFVRRDLPKIMHLSKLIAFVKSIKDESYEPSVSLDDISAAMGIVLESNAIVGTKQGSLMGLVNSARGAYSSIREEMDTPDGFGIREAVWQAAVYSGVEDGFESYMKNIEYGVSQLNAQCNGVAEPVVRSRVLADLVVLEHFSNNFKDDVVKALGSGDEAFDAFVELYEREKHRSSVYEHRLGSVIR